MKIDLYYYKAHEILPPVYRLFASIEEINKDYISKIMGIKEQDRKHL